MKAMPMAGYAYAPGASQCKQIYQNDELSLRMKRKAFSSRGFANGIASRRDALRTLHFITLAMTKDVFTHLGCSLCTCVIERGATKFEVLQHDFGVPQNDFEVPQNDFEVPQNDVEVPQHDF
ncbi:MAG: hypothetical protein V7L20_32545 [Nostoc sp.]|uniref:hypothetical protein n=1 Tax=Nostoc sp. TaxID=1180 RepID=UPI002FF8080D